MKPCSKNRKPIVWLAMDALEASQEDTLRMHLRTCAGCRGYLEEISSLKQNLTAVQVSPEIEASSAFHRRVATAVKARRISAGERALARLRTTIREWALESHGKPGHWLVGLAGATVVISFLCWVSVPRPARLVYLPTDVQAVLPKDKADFAPTISNYQMLASRSFERFDEVLTSQGNKERSSTPIYTASSRSRVDVFE